MSRKGAWNRRPVPAHVIAARQERGADLRARGGRRGRRAWDLPPLPRIDVRQDMPGETGKSEQEERSPVSRG
jgi:hypothetical protein